MTRLYHNFDANATHYYILLHSLNSNVAKLGTQDLIAQIALGGNPTTINTNDYMLTSIIVTDTSGGIIIGCLTIPSGKFYGCYNLIVDTFNGQNVTLSKTGMSWNNVSVTADGNDRKVLIYGVCKLR